MDRIQNHPILGESPEGRKVTFYYDGNPLEGIEGEPIMAALKVNGVMVHRYTAKKHEPRGVFCAIGRCTDCVMIVDGKPNVRTCITPLAARHACTDAIRCSGEKRGVNNGNQTI